jgi:hypothetical protein
MLTYADTYLHATTGTVGLPSFRPATVTLVDTVAVLEDHALTPVAAMYITKMSTHDLQVIKNPFHPCHLCPTKVVSLHC